MTTITLLSCLFLGLCRRFMNEHHNCLTAEPFATLELILAIDGLTIGDIDAMRAHIERVIDLDNRIAEMTCEAAECCRNADYAGWFACDEQRAAYRRELKQLLFG